jgi:hypothetical protein
VRLLDFPAAGNTGLLRLEKVKMMDNYWQQSENADACGKILGIDTQQQQLILKCTLLKGDSGPMITAGKPHIIPIVNHV